MAPTRLLPSSEIKPISIAAGNEQFHGSGRAPLSWRERLVRSAYRRCRSWLDAMRRRLSGR